MPQPIYFNRFHVYTLRQPLRPNSPISYALVVTNDKFTNRRELPVVSVLFLHPSPREFESDIRVHLQCRSNGGVAHLPHDHWVVVDQLTPIPDKMLVVTSGTPIADHEGREITAKLRDWLDL